MNECSLVVTAGEADDAPAFDAVVLVGFGGPERPDEVMPFLERVTYGRGVSRERLEKVAEHYYARGGRSPINDQMRDLRQRVAAALGPDLPVYWGNRNSSPFLTDTVAEMAADGVRSAAAFVPSAYSSYSGCRQYQEDIEQALQSGGQPGLSITKLRPFHNHPGFIDPFVDQLNNVTDRNAAETLVLFTAHSIPVSMAQVCDYEEQLRDSAKTIADGAGVDAWHLVYQSRSGPPHVPWLEPDVVDVIGAHPDPVERVVVVPIGFCTDHMEVLQDLDVDAANATHDRGATFVRLTTPGSDPRFVSMIVDLIDEQRAAVPAASVGLLGVRPTPCVVGCCPAPPRRR